MAKTRIALVGGFLGAGKTSFLFAVANRLAEMGKTVGLVTNDQVAGLVDTAFLKHAKGTVTEVYGSCFCCNFPGFASALKCLRGGEPNLILAEPVGSCTDLSATVMQPLKEQFVSEEFSVAPLSVLVSPSHLSSILGDETTELHPSAAYIARKQLDEADVILVSKADLLVPGEILDLKERVERMWPGRTILAVSSKTGEGLDAWLREIEVCRDAGNRLLEVDYDIYAEGEAVLGWLNATIALSSKRGVPWDSFAESLIVALKGRFENLAAPVAHIKLILEAESGFGICNLTGGEKATQRSSFRGSGGEAEMTLNARVQMSPEDLEKIVSEEVAAACGQSFDMRVLTLKSLSPGRPNPTYRYAKVAGGRK